MTKQDGNLMTTAEVARAFGVLPITVTRWARLGKLDAIRTLGGHRRFYRDQVNELVESLREDRR